MIKKIARKEFTEMMRDGRFRWMAGIVLALLLSALAIGWKQASEVRAEREAARRVARAQWVGQGAKNPHTAAHFGTYVFKPEWPLSFVDRGVDAYLGITLYLEAHWQNPDQYRPVEDGSPAQRFGELTAAAVLQLLLPLLCVLLSFSAFAGEREQGTLRQALSLGVRKRDLAIGKALGVAAALGLLLAPATAVGVTALALLSESTLWDAQAARAALMGCGYLLYLGGFIGLSLAVSALARSARFALIALLAFWIANGLILPRAVSDLSKRLYPTPSAFEFHERIYSEKEHGVDGHNSEDERLAELKASVLRQYGVAKVEDLPLNFEGIALQAGEEYTNGLFDKYYGSLWDAFERQNRFHQISGALAPLLAVRSLSMGLAGTDFAQHRHFAEAAEQYRRRLVKMLNDDLTAKSKTGDFSYFGDERVWAQAPEFEYRAPSVGWVIERQLWSLAVLAAWFLIAGAVLLWAVGRMRIDFEARPVRRLSVQGLLKKRPAVTHFPERS